MSDKIKPQLISALACDQVITDQNNKNTLVGLFSNIYADGFPVAHPSMALFLAWLTNNNIGKFQLRITHIDPQGSENTLLKDQEIEFRENKIINYFIFNINGFVFNQRGEHKFAVYLNNSKEVEVPVIVDKPPTTVRD